jgi:hypothetical protein
MRQVTFALTALILLAFTTLAEAQLAVRFYLVPKVVVTLPFGDVLVPKYTQPGDLGVGWDLDNRWSAMDYGLEDLFLLAVDNTPAEHTSLAAQVDVIAVPSPISDNVSAAAVSVIQTRLEGANLPASWVTTGHTYQQVLAIVGRVVAFAQAYHGQHNLPLFTGGATLNTQINQIPQAARQRLQSTAQSLNLDYSSVTSTTTIRQVLLLIAQQMPGFTLRGVQF